MVGLGGEGDEAAGKVRLPGSCRDTGGEDRHPLHRLRQWADEIDAGDGQEFAHLLEADLGIAAGDDGRDPLALDAPAALAHGVGKAEARKRSVER